jgi:hypothetical protein
MDRQWNNVTSCVSATYEAVVPSPYRLSAKDEISHALISLPTLSPLRLLHSLPTHREVVGPPSRHVIEVGNRVSRLELPARGVGGVLLRRQLSPHLLLRLGQRVELRLGLGLGLSLGLGTVCSQYAR